MLDYPAAHSTDTCWFAVDTEGEIACFMADTDTSHLVPCDVTCAGGYQDNASPDDFPRLTRKRETESMYRYRVVDRDLYERVWTPTKKVELWEKLCNVRLASLPIRFADTSFVNPVHYVECSAFGERIGPYPMEAFLRCAFVNRSRELCPLPSKLGEPTEFFDRLAELAVFAAKYDLVIPRDWLHGYSSIPVREKVLSATRQLDEEIEQALEADDVQTFEVLGKAIDTLRMLC